MSKLSCIAQALVIRALRNVSDEQRYGAALASLRADVLTGVHDTHPAADGVDEIRLRVVSLGVADMPPPTDLVGVLIEALSQNLGGIGRAAAWRSIGISPGRGRDLMARSAHAVDWPVWRTLRDAALGARP